MWASSHAVSLAWLDHLTIALDDPPDRRYTSFGQVAWDDCHQFTVGPERVFSSRSFPAPAAEHIPCMTGFMVLPMLATLVHCAPTANDFGQPPSVAALNEAHSALMAEADRLHRKIECEPLHNDQTAPEITAVGSLGALLAVEVRWMVGLDQETWPPEVP